MADFDYNKVHNTSFAEILRNQRLARENTAVEKEVKTETKPETPVEEKVDSTRSFGSERTAPTPDTKPEVKPDVKPEIVEHDTKKETEEAFFNAQKKLKEEEDKVKQLEFQKAQQAKEEEELLIPKWKREGRETPKDYEEILEETNRIALIKAKKLFDENMSRYQDEQKKALEDQQQKQQQAQQQVADHQAAIERDVVQKITELVDSGKLPKIVNGSDENDPGVKAQKSLLESAVKVNTERLAKNLPPISNIKEIFYEHYNQEEQPAGASAPVSGGKSVVKADIKTDEYDYKKMHNMSFYEIARQARQRQKQGRR